MKLIWLLPSMEDRERHFDFLERDSFESAVRLDDRIESQCEMLERFPEMGREGRVAGTRELVIEGTPYLAAYRIVGGEVRVLRVLHGAQTWPEAL